MARSASRSKPWDANLTVRSACFSVSLATTRSDRSGEGDLAPHAAISAIVLGRDRLAARPRRSAALTPMPDIESLQVCDDVACERGDARRRLPDDEQNRRDTAQHADQEQHRENVDIGEEI